MTAAALDANIIASASITDRTPPGQILEAWRHEQFRLILSEHLLEELRRTLQKAYFRSRLPPDRCAEFLDRLVTYATVVPLTVSVQGVASHPEDDLVLATALSGHAEYLVTGDRQLLRLGS